MKQYSELCSEESEMQTQFPINKRRFIDRTAAFYIVNGRIKNVVRVVATMDTAWSADWVYRMTKVPKDAGMRNQVTACFRNNFEINVKRFALYR